jgi:hypothetical protein
MNPTRIRELPSATRIREPLSDISSLDQYRFPTTPLKTGSMLARLRLGKFASTSKAAIMRGHNYRSISNETCVSKFSPTEEDLNTGADKMEVDKDTLRCENTGNGVKARTFVKPGSVQYHAFEVDKEMSMIMKRVADTYPTACSESVYQKAVLREAYLAGLPVMVERDVFVDYGNGSLLMGRVDMEVAGVCLYELKVGKPNIEVHAMQLQKYIQAYDQNKENIQVAKLVYFTSNRVITHVMRDATPARV